MGELHGDDAVLASQTFTAEGRLHATYNFNLLEWGGLDVAGLRQAITDAVEAFNNSGRLVFAFSNHDVPRSVTRQLGALGLSSEHQDALQLLLLKLEVSLVGSSCIYQGEELALEDVQNIPVEKMRDPWGIEFAPNFAGRDSCRTPMVWQSDTRMADFQMPRIYGCRRVRGILPAQHWNRQRQQSLSISNFRPFFTGANHSLR